MSNISTFISSFNNTELSRAYNFTVDIGVPGGVLNLINNFISTDPTSAELKDAWSGVGLGSTLSLRCDSAELPGRTFAIVEQKTYGPVNKFPVQNAYDQITLSFLCSDDMREKVFFDSWLSFISANYYSAIPGIGASFGRLAFDFEYKDNYATNITVTQKTLDGRDAYKSILKEAFPISVNAMPLSWEAQNTINKISVTFAFRYFTDNMFKNITLQVPFI